MHKRFVIIPAGGVGLRMQSDLPKQFLLLNDAPVIVQTIRLFLSIVRIEKIIVPIHSEWVNYFNELKEKYHLPSKVETIKGGQTRFHSVKNALNVLSSDGLVAIHDAARPLASKKLIEMCFAESENRGNATASIAVKDSIYYLNKEEYKNADRNNFRLAQTPQCFNLSEIREAYKTLYNTIYNDDASVYSAAGYKLNLIEGEPTNIKITTVEDLVVAKAIQLKNGS